MENYQIEESEKNGWIALILCIFGGVFGVHHFYAGNIGKGLIYIFTLGLLGIGWIIDIFLILLGKFKDNNGAPLKSTKFNNEVITKVNTNILKEKSNENDNIEHLLKNEYHYMIISKISFIIWLIIATIITVLSVGFLSFTLIIPLCRYFTLKNCKYYYDNEKMIIETGIFNKRQCIVPLYRITNITAQDNIFNYGCIYIQDKQQLLVLRYVENSKAEMLALVEKWKDAKEQNVRHEII